MDAASSSSFANGASMMLNSSESNQLLNFSSIIKDDNDDDDTNTLDISSQDINPLDITVLHDRFAATVLPPPAPENINNHTNHTNATINSKVDDTASVHMKPNEFDTSDSVRSFKGLASQLKSQHALEKLVEMLGRQSEVIAKQQQSIADLQRQMSKFKANNSASSTENTENSAGPLRQDQLRDVVKSILICLLF